MSATIIENLGKFTAGNQFEQLPAEVVNESKRILLDSIGCALGSINDPKGKIGIDYGRLLGGASGPATIIGTSDRTSVFGAAFANGELISALDFDAILPPGHVSPYVLPGAMAIAEAQGVSGKEMLNVTAISHEMSFRLGKATDYLRDVKDGKVTPPKVYGYSSTVFGATAAIVRLKGLSAERTAHALGIAGSIAPVNSHRAWTQHVPSATIKYLMAGVLAQTALTAAHMGEMGHRGDLQTLDDPEFGFPRFIGTTRWEPDCILAGIGEDWRFTAESAFKPYPHCRILHPLLDCMIAMLEKNDIKPAEIDGIHALVEGFVMQPIWLNNRIEHTQDGQFSIAHGLSLGAHRFPIGKAWQDPKAVYDPSVLALMSKVSFAIHPDYERALKEHPSSRPSRIEVKARGQTFVAEASFPKGVPSPDPSTYMTTEELVTKFRGNAEGVLTTVATDQVLEVLLDLEHVKDFSSVMRLLRV